MKKKYKYIISSMMLLLLTATMMVSPTGFDGNDDDGWHSETTISVTEIVKL